MEGQDLALPERLRHDHRLLEGARVARQTEPHEPRGAAVELKIAGLHEFEPRRRPSHAREEPIGVLR